MRCGQGVMAGGGARYMNKALGILKGLHQRSVCLGSSLKLLFSCSVMSNSLQLHGLQHTRLPCPSPPPGARSNSCPLRQWCHPTISSSVTPFSSCPQHFPASGSFCSFRGKKKTNTGHSPPWLPSEHELVPVPKVDVGEIHVKKTLTGDS